MTVRRAIVAGLTAQALAAGAAFADEPYFRFQAGIPGPASQGEATNPGPPAAGGNTVETPPPAPATLSVASGYPLQVQGEVAESGACTPLSVSNPGGTAAEGVVYSVAPTEDFAACDATGNGIAPCNGTVPANGSCSVGVRLRTATAGFRSGTLTLSSTNAVPSTATAAVSGTRAAPSATASNTPAISDSPGSSYIYASNEGGSIVDRYYDGNERTGMGVANGGYTGVVFPKVVLVNGLSLSMSMGQTQNNEYRFATIDYVISYLDGTGAWRELPRRSFYSNGAFGLPTGQPQAVDLGTIAASEIRITTYFGSTVHAAGIMTFRPYY